MNNNTENLIYIAAIIDARASFFICRNYISSINQHVYMAGIELCISDKDLCDFIYNFFDRPPTIIRRGESISDRTGLTFRQRSLDSLLDTITPYLRYKKKYAEVLIKFRDTYKTKYSKKGIHGSPPVPEHILDIRKNCFEELRKLNL
jgi:hypothetical protein